MTARKISALQPGETATLVAKLTHKELKKYSEQRNMFILNFADESGDVRAIGWDDVFSIFENALVEGKSYSIANVVVQKSRYGDRPELKFVKDTRLTVSSEDVQERPSAANICDALNLEKDAKADLYGVVARCGEQFKQLRADGHSKKKRRLTIADGTATMDVTVFDDASDASFVEGEVVRMKRLKKSDYNGHTFSSWDAPTTGEARAELEAWWKEGGQKWGDALALERIKDVPVETRLVVKGVITQVMPESTLKNGSVKKTIVIGDPSGHTIEVSLFKEAAARPVAVGDVVRITQAKVSSWNELSLSVWGLENVEVVDDPFVTEWADRQDMDDLKALTSAYAPPTNFVKIKDIAEGRCDAIGVLDIERSTLRDETGEIAVKFFKTDQPFAEGKQIVAIYRVQRGQEGLVVYSDTRLVLNPDCLEASFLNGMLRA